MNFVVKWFFCFHITLLIDVDSNFMAVKQESTTKPESETISITATFVSKPELLRGTKNVYMSTPSETRHSESAGEFMKNISLRKSASGEPEPETKHGIAEVEVEPVAEERPKASEIILPPFMLSLVIFFGLLILICVNRKHRRSFSKLLRQKPKSKQNKLTLKTTVKVLQGFNITNKEQNKDDIFLTSFDLEVLNSFKNYFNNPLELLCIATPALISLALCPVTLYLYEPFTIFLWPKEKYVVPPNINDAISCFLAPAGLVYATSFGFAFQQALNKQSEVLNKVTTEISMIDHIATFSAKLKFSNHNHLKAVYQAIKDETIFMILQIMNRSLDSFNNKPHNDIRVRIWYILDVLKHLDINDSDQVDRVLSEMIINNITLLNSICSDRMGIMHAKIHPVKWAFLETLGFFSFIGVLLLQAQSYRMELVMCVITVFSISMLCYVVSDLDSPFSGFFQVDLSVLTAVIERIENMFLAASRGESSMIFYPEQTDKKKRSLEKPPE